MMNRFWLLPMILRDDFDNRVIDYLIKQYEKKTSTEVSKNLRASGKLKPEVEKDAHVKTEAINNVVLSLVFQRFNSSSKGISVARSLLRILIQMRLLPTVPTAS
jgi:molecular chaperone DnaK (HSP70)